MGYTLARQLHVVPRVSHSTWPALLSPCALSESGMQLTMSPAVFSDGDRVACFQTLKAWVTHLLAQEVHVVDCM